MFFCEVGMNLEALTLITSLTLMFKVYSYGAQSIKAKFISLLTAFL